MGDTTVSMTSTQFIEAVKAKANLGYGFIRAEAYSRLGKTWDTVMLTYSNTPEAYRRDGATVANNRINMAIEGFGREKDQPAPGKVKLDILAAEVFGRKDRPRRKTTTPAKMVDYVVAIIEKAAALGPRLPPGAGPLPPRPNKKTKTMSTPTLKLIRSKKNPETVKFEIGGKHKRTALRGYTQPFNTGLGPIGYQGFDKILTLNRADGTGRDLPLWSDARREVLLRLAEAEKAGLAPSDKPAKPVKPPKVRYEVALPSNGGTQRFETKEALLAKYKARGVETRANFRKVLQGQPKLEGAAGPMYNGMTNGVVTIRYEGYPEKATKGPKTMKLNDKLRAAKGDKITFAYKSGGKTQPERTHVVAFADEDEIRLKGPRGEKTGPKLVVGTRGGVQVTADGRTFYEVTTARVERKTAPKAKAKKAPKIQDKKAEEKVDLRKKYNLPGKGPVPDNPAAIMAVKPTGGVSVVEFNTAEDGALTAKVYAFDAIYVKGSSVVEATYMPKVGKLIVQVAKIDGADRIVRPETFKEALKRVQDPRKRSTTEDSVSKTLEVAKRDVLNAVGVASALARFSDPIAAFKKRHPSAFKAEREAAAKVEREAKKAADKIAKDAAKASGITEARARVTERKRKATERREAQQRALGTADRCDRLAANYESAVNLDRVSEEEMPAAYFRTEDDAERRTMVFRVMYAGVVLAMRSQAEAEKARMLKTKTARSKAMIAARRFRERAEKVLSPIHGHTLNDLPKDPDGAAKVARGNLNSVLKDVSKASTGPVAKEMYDCARDEITGQYRKRLATHAEHKRQVKAAMQSSLFAAPAKPKPAPKKAAPKEVKKPSGFMRPGVARRDVTQKSLDEIRNRRGTPSHVKSAITREPAKDLGKMERAVLAKLQGPPYRLRPGEMLDVGFFANIAYFNGFMKRLKSPEQAAFIKLLKRGKLRIVETDVADTFAGKTDEARRQRSMSGGPVRTYAIELSKQAPRTYETTQEVSFAPKFDKPKRMAEELGWGDAAKLVLNPNASVRSYNSSMDTLESLGLYAKDGTEFKRSDRTKRDRYMAILEDELRTNLRLKEQADEAAAKVRAKHAANDKITDAANKAFDKAFRKALKAKDDGDKMVITIPALVKAFKDAGYTVSRKSPASGKHTGLVVHVMPGDDDTTIALSITHHRPNMQYALDGEVMDRDNVNMVKTYLTQSAEEDRGKTFEKRTLTEKAVVRFAEQAIAGSRKWLKLEGDPLKAREAKIRAEHSARRKARGDTPARVEAQAFETMQRRAAKALKAAAPFREYGPNYVRALDRKAKRVEDMMARPELRTFLPELEKALEEEAKRAPALSRLEARSAKAFAATDAAFGKAFGTKKATKDTEQFAAIAVLKRLKEGDTIEVNTRDLKKPRKLEVTYVSTSNGATVVGTTSGKVRPGHRSGGALTYRPARGNLPEDLLYQPTLLQQVQEITSLKRLAEAPAPIKTSKPRKSKQAPTTMEQLVALERKLNRVRRDAAKGDYVTVTYAYQKGKTTSKRFKVLGKPPASTSQPEPGGKLKLERDGDRKIAYMGGKFLQVGDKSYPVREVVLEDKTGRDKGPSATKATTPAKALKQATDKQVKAELKRRGLEDTKENRSLCAQLMGRRGGKAKARKEKAYKERAKKTGKTVKQVKKKDAQTLAQIRRELSKGF